MDHDTNLSVVHFDGMSHRQRAEIQLQSLFQEPIESFPAYARRPSTLNSIDVLSVNDISKMLKIPLFITEHMIQALNRLLPSNKPSPLNTAGTQRMIRILSSTLDVRALVFYTMCDRNNDHYLSRDEITIFYENYLKSEKLFDKSLTPRIIGVLLQKYHLDTKSQIDFEEFYAILQNDEKLLESFSQFTIDPSWTDSVEKTAASKNLLQRLFRQISQQEKYIEEQKYKLTLEYIQNNMARIVVIIIYILINLALTLYAIVYRAAILKASVFVVFARIGGILLDFNCTLILALMLKQTILLIRSSEILRKILPVDDHIDFHKFLGRYITILSLIHTIAHIINFTRLTKTYSWLTFMITTKPGIGWISGSAPLTGVILCVILAIMIICSMGWVRRTGHFQIFYWTHYLYIPFFVCLIIHAEAFWKWLIAPFTIFIIEKTYLILKRYSAYSGRTYLLSATIEPSNVICLTIHRPKHFTFKPGDYIYINVPSIARYEYHPFTISSAPEESNYVRVHIHARGDWTKRLYQRFKDMSQNQANIGYVNIRRMESNNGTTEVQRNHQDQAIVMEPQDVTATNRKKDVVLIDGPYSSCARYIFNCKHVILIGSGIGITPYASILSSLMAQFRSSRSICRNCQHVNYRSEDVMGHNRLKKVDFIWVNRDAKSFEWFLELLRQFEQEQEDYLNMYREEKRFLDIHLYFTGVQQEQNIGHVFLQQVTNLWVEEVGNDIFTKLKSKTRFGRPNWTDLFNNVIQNDNNSAMKDANVFFCGPKTMGKAIQQHCRNLGIHYYEEKF